jgi:hypothetical protein
MSFRKLGGALVVAFFLPTAAVAAQNAAHGWHRHHHARVIGSGIVGPGIVGPNWDLYGSPDVGVGSAYGYYGGAEGALYGRDSGGVNSMSNDFGTSGVLGHTNGMPVTGH